MKRAELFISTKKVERDDIKGNDILEKAYKEMDNSTITPRTFKSRNFETSLNDFWFKDEYEFKGSTITFFGINEKNIPPHHLGGNVKVINKKDASSTNSKKYTEEATKNVKHTSLEKDLFLKGLEHLLEHNNSTVLVDIFDRDMSEIVMLKGNSYVQTHTVVLYKNPIPNTNGTTEIIVIDPNNFIYSSHLKHLQNDQIYSSLKSLHPFEIKTKHATLPIYKSNTEHHRDCTDVAVKVALGLEAHKSENLDLDTIRQHQVIQLLSNQTFISKFANEELPFRIKQTTSIKTIKAFNEIGKVISDTLSKVNELDNGKYQKLLQEYNQTANFGTNKFILEELLALSQKFVTEYKVIIDDNYKQLNCNYNQLIDLNTELNTELSGTINLNEEEL